jgi:hypothetical protein
MSHVCNRCRRFLAFAMLAGVLTTLLSFAEVRAQGVQQKNMDRMPGMGGYETGNDGLRHRNSYRRQHGG